MKYTQEQGACQLTAAAELQSPSEILATKEMAESSGTSAKISISSIAKLQSKFGSFQSSSGRTYGQALSYQLQAYCLPLRGSSHVVMLDKTMAELTS